MVAKKLKSTYSGEGYDIIVDDGSHQNLHTNAAFDELWPLTKGDGYYFMEDIGEPAFSYLDCEPISHTAEKQNITTLAKIAEILRPMVLKTKNEIVRAECML